MTDIRRETIQERSTLLEDCFNMDNLINDGAQKCTDSALPVPSIKDTEGSEKESHVTSPVEDQQSKSVLSESSDEESLDLASEVSKDDSEWEDITTDDDDSDLDDDNESVDLSTDDELSDSSESSNADPSDKNELEAKGSGNKSDGGSRKRKYDPTNFKEILGMEPKDIVDAIIAEKDKLMPLVSLDKKIELLQCYKDEIDLVQETVEYFALEALRSTKNLIRRYKKVCKREKNVDK